MKNKIKIEIPPNLKTDIQNLGNEVAKQIAIMSRDGLSECYENAIEYFYSSYSPIYYIRNVYKGRFALYSTYKKYYTNAHGNIFYGGIRISPNYIPEMHDAPNQVVLNLSLDGWHGVVTGDPMIDIHSTPTPWDFIDDYKLYVLDNIQKWGDIAITQAKRTRKYTMLFK